MFDSLPETRGNGKMLAPRSLSTAVLAHGLVIALIVSAAVLARVDAGEDPPKPYELVRVIPALLPEGTNLEAGGGGKPEKAPAPELRKTPPETAAEPTQPILVETPVTVPEPVAAPAPPEAPAPDPSSPADDGESGLGGPGTGGGKGKGHGKGIGDGEEDGTFGVPGGLKDPSDDNIYVVTGGVEAPVLIRKVEPEYPEIARQAHKQGNVILQAVIGTDGRVESVTVLKSEPLLDRAAIRAVSQWVYKPGKLRGLPVKVFFTVYVEFRLN